MGEEERNRSQDYSERSEDCRSVKSKEERTIWNKGSKRTKEKNICKSAVRIFNLL